MPRAIKSWLRTAGTPGVSACDNEARRGHASVNPSSQTAARLWFPLPRLLAGCKQAQEPSHPSSAVHFWATGGQLGLPLHTWSLG